MEPADPAPKAFSTVGLPAARQVELWESHNATALIGLDVQASDPLVATELNVRLSHVDLARVKGSAHVVRRTKEVIERSPAGAIVVYLSLRGAAWFQRADRAYTLRPGNVLICETDRPFARGFRRGFEELVVKAARTALPEVAQLSRPVITSSHDNAPNGLYARTLAKITSRATRTDWPALADERTVLDLIAVLADGGASAPSTAHRAAARSYMEEHLTDPILGVEEVAAAIGISERQLSRVFAADSTSVPRHILSHRLHLAYSMLFSNAGSQTTYTVAEIAAQCGFMSATYFSRTFRQHFGHRASDIAGGRRT
jgi:AraC-like DNA-binding protein